MGVDISNTATFVNVGGDIVELQKLINTPVTGRADWARSWQTSAEHVLFLAHVAKDSMDLDRLADLDAEARKLIAYREEMTK